MLSLLLAVTIPEPANPIEFAKRELGDLASRVEFVSAARLGPESYKIAGTRERAKIYGGDARGLMYGAMEFAERHHNAPGPINASGKPFLADRGLNLFLTLPWDYKKNDTDYSLDALTNPDKWWFHNEDYWTTLLDLMARSRLNWLDIHGAWDISVTNAPNLYAYFVTSSSFPNVGVPPEIKAKNLAQLNHIIQMAHARGIRVSLMAYEANLRIPQNPSPGYEASEANIYRYTKEVVEQIIRRAPNLDALGYRIGESGKGESFFHCYGEAVKASGRDIPLITRSWITRRQNVLPLARASKDYTVQIKYNGEQWGAPYMVAGGRMANWYSYSFEDYLSDSSGIPPRPSGGEGVRGEGASPAKLWPGNPANGGGNWPSNPYKIVWQVRANGTHRIFPFYNPEMVRSTIKTMKIGTATGYTIEGLDAYYPKSPDYYLANPADKYCNWIHERDEMYWMTWGRLGYDPTVKDEVFDNHMKKWFGEQSNDIAGRWHYVSNLVPKIFSHFSIGPDHRNHAPELEAFGDTDAFVQGEPFDSFVNCSIREFELMRTLGLNDGRETPPNLAYSLDLLPFLRDDRNEPPLNARHRELEASMKMIYHLGDYYAASIRSAVGIVEHERLTGKRRAGDYSRRNADAAVASWQALSDSPDSKYYRPFTERLRLRTNTFHWSSLLPNVRQARDQVKALPGNTVTTHWKSRSVNDGPGAQLTWKRDGQRVEFAISGENVVSAKLLYKPLPSSTFFHSVRMKAQNGRFTTELWNSQAGLCVAAEVRDRSNYVRRTAGLTTKYETPYQIVPALAGPTPQIYSTEEALTYLDPWSLGGSHSSLLVCPRAMRFHNGFDKSTIRKVLGPIERGLTMLVMQQDYVSGRYKMDWLPKPLGVENNPDPGVFDPGGALGLKRIETNDILWQRFKPSPGWEVFGNGGVAHLKWGEGHIWMVNARLMQRMTYPDCARALKTLMQVCGTGFQAKSATPGRAGQVVILDPGTEDAAYSTSFFPDFLNMLDIPFLTLGEVISDRQGIRSFAPIPGLVSVDDILKGEGERMVNAFLRNQVIQASKRPTPSNLAEFERERVLRKAELYRCLGLDPMPPKTPLNARITGTIQRPGYRIEKVVFESRPKFYVTAHVYVPRDQNRSDKSDTSYPSDQSPTNLTEPRRTSPNAKHPIIVNVNGHWAHKKNEDRIQLRAAFQALQGYIAICVDSPGWSFEGNSLIERRAEGNHNDWFLVHGGTNATGYYVWDCIRALDYMATRPDADMSKIGITGASGGGLATLYAFAADDRYTAAMPVVYMASMELAPDNGCLCNHVPGTSQIGDRSDVIAIQAPKPVLVIGAQNDPEFPPDAMMLTVEKMKKTWKLYGLEARATGRIFPGPHDYNQAMREQMIGFFNLHLKGDGNGSPIPQPPLEAINPEDRQLLVLDPPAADERTMRDLTLEGLARLAEMPPSSLVDPVLLFGGWPKIGDLMWKEIVVNETERLVTFESEPGFITPGIMLMPTGPPSGLRIWVSDKGKNSLVAGLLEPRLRRDGMIDLCIDILGTGELSRFEMRYLVYLGQSAAFKAAWQIVRAAEPFKGLKGSIQINAKGPISAFAAAWVSKLNPWRDCSIGYDGIPKRWEDLFAPGVSPLVVQPRMQYFSRPL